MKSHFDPDEMSRSHSREFRFLLDSLKRGRIPITPAPMEAVPELHGNSEALIDDVLRSAGKSFADGRLFNFNLMPNDDIIRLATHLVDTKDVELHPPFEDWRFCFCATSDFGGPSADPSTPPFATSFYVLEGKDSRTVQLSEFIVVSGSGQLNLSLVMYFELPMSVDARVHVAVCNQYLADRKREITHSALEPCQAALVLLNTKGVGYEEKKPARAERRRAERKGEASAIHWDVDASEYFTALRHKGANEQGEEGQLGHASPIPHLRRGHWRNLANGDRIWVRDCLVNVRAQDQSAFVEQRRLAYDVSHNAGV